jgi:hypothetical protein
VAQSKLALAFVLQLVAGLSNVPAVSLVGIAVNGSKPSFDPGV